jgi:hypothetical protein
VAWSAGVVASSLSAQWNSARGRWVARGLSGAAIAAAATSIVTFSTILEQRNPVHPWRYGRLEAAERLRTELPPGTPVGSWWAGALAHYSGQPVVNLDGLVNDVLFLEHLHAGTEWQYLRDEGIRYVADYFPVDPLLAHSGPDRSRVVGDFLARLRTIRTLRVQGLAVRTLEFWPDPAKPETGDAGYYILEIGSSPATTSASPGEETREASERAQ